MADDDPKPEENQNVSRRQKVDSELEEFRGLMEVPSTFEDGFSWTAFAGALFVGLIMVPGAMYMALLAGEMSIGPAAQWVTVILFIEAARRAQKNVKRAEIYVLFFMAGTAMSMPFYGLLWNQFYIRSDAAQANGIAELLPFFFAPPPESESYGQRTFLHIDWLPVVGLVLFQSFFSQLSNLVLGYGLFRVASDIEKLPFPMAPIGAQGIMALAEDVGQRASSADGQRSWRWRMFSIGGALGLGFGAIYLGLPTLTGIVLDSPIQIFPIPFVDWTPKTGTWLPAVATGLSWDLNNVLIGMVLPFWAVVGSFIGLVVTIILNPLLFDQGILVQWTPGDNTIETMFKNNVDFYFSFQIGVSLAIAVAGIAGIIVQLRRRAKEAGRKKSVVKQSSVPPGRGDIPTWMIIAVYVGVTSTYIIVSMVLLKIVDGQYHMGVLLALIFLGFIYTPFISYVTARLEGIAGQVIEIPMIREASLILSGYKGVAIWFLPIPIANYGIMTVMYRQAELTGTRFTSLWKAQLFLYPIILAAMVIFGSFIWSLAEVPSAVYPFAQIMWELEANNRSIIFSSTLGGYSIFEQAFSWAKLGLGLGFGVLLFATMSFVSAPVFLTYGVVRGLGQSMPHLLVPQFIGALIGRFVFQRRFGKLWRQYIPVIAAGYMCGQGLITVACVGITFLSKAAIQLPF